MVAKRKTSEQAASDQAYNLWLGEFNSELRGAGLKPLAPSSRQAKEYYRRGLPPVQTLSGIGPLPAERAAAGLRRIAGTFNPMDVPGYEQLAQVLLDAFRQASAGKGKERHANDLPFHEQPMQQIAKRRGLGFILGQADKKSEEAQGMLERGEIAAWEHEIHGAIVYLAGAIIHVRNKQA